MNQFNIDQVKEVMKANLVKQIQDKEEEELKKQQEEAKHHKAAKIRITNLYVELVDKEWIRLNKPLVDEILTYPELKTELNNHFKLKYVSRSKYYKVSLNSETLNMYKKMRQEIKEEITNGVNGGTRDNKTN